MKCINECVLLLQFSWVAGGKKKVRGIQALNISPNVPELQDYRDCSVW